MELVTGNVTCFADGYFQWTIEDYFSMACFRNDGVKSQDFDFLDGSFYLFILLNRQKGVLKVVLRRNVIPFSYRVHVELIIRMGYKSKQETHSGEIGGFGKFTVYVRMGQSEIRKRLETQSDECITITCRLKRLDTENDTSLLLKELSSQEVNSKKEIEEDEVKDENMSRFFRSLLSLSDNLKEIFLTGDGCDVTLVVKKKKFRAHTTILRARSKVFSPMLTHDMLERNTGVVTIDDCEPGAFQELLLFLYSGKAENLTEDNMIHLYYAADKYDVADLKTECVEFMKRSLSVDAICEVIILAVKHSESDLLTCAIEYFVENIDKILETVHWQKFLNDHPTEANELYIRALKKIRART